MEQKEVLCSIQRKAVNKLKQLVEALEASYTDDGQCNNNNDTKRQEQRKYDKLRKVNNINPCMKITSRSDSVSLRMPRRQPLPTKVTVDGRLLCDQPHLPNESQIPNRPPPFYRPRYPSVELRGGVHYNNCDCVRRNGLQDDCPRWDCSGRPECTDSPWPTCCPQEHCHYFGVRKPNYEVLTKLVNGDTFDQYNC